MISKIKKELKNFEGLRGFKYSSRHASFLYRDHDRTLRVALGEIISVGLRKQITNAGFGSVEINRLKNLYEDLSAQYVIRPVGSLFSNISIKPNYISNDALSRSAGEPYSTETELMERIDRYKRNIEINLLPFFERYKSLDAICEHIQSYSFDELVTDSILHAGWPFTQFDAIILAKYGGLGDRYELWLDATYSAINRRKADVNRHEKAEKVESALEVVLERLNSAEKGSVGVEVGLSAVDKIDDGEDDDGPLIISESYMGFIMKHIDPASDISDMLELIIGAPCTQSSDDITLQDAVDGMMSSLDIHVYQQQDYALCIVTNPDMMQRIDADAISAGQHTVLIYGAESVSGLRVLRRFDKGAEVIHHVEAGSNIMIDHRTAGYESTASIDEQISTQIESFLGSLLTSLSGSSPCNVYKLTS